MPFDKKFWISFAVVFVLTMALGFLVHGVVLADDYASLTGVMRPAAEQEARFGFMIAAHAILAFGFSWLYRAGRETGKPWLGQGLRFGIAFALAASVPTYLIYHTVANFPLDLAIKQVVLETVSVIVVGVSLAFVNK
jgi:Protein of unknown function (DUF1761)